MIGHTFTILTAGGLTGGVQGTFDHEVLPAGYLWDVIYGANSVMLSVIGLGLTGDYNGDGMVNAADYTVWRNALQSNNPAADGDKSGTVDWEDYLVWKNNYGLPGSGAGVASGNLSEVPEPASASLLLLAAFLIALAARSRRR
jgi:hypothetical protein